MNVPLMTCLWSKVETERSFLRVPPRPTWPSTNPPTFVNTFLSPPELDESSIDLAQV